MNSRSALALILIVSLVVVPGLQLAFGASSSSTTTTSTTTASPGSKGPYSEKLDIYTAGTYAYWRVTLSPVNATQTGIAAAEAVSGVSAYELTALKTTTATTGSELFWSDGYKIVNLPFMPDAGAFLNVTATSQSAAQSAAAGFDTFLNADFLPVASSGDNYTFFSVAAFANAGSTIFASMPKAFGGLANLTTIGTFEGEPTPIAILTGVRSGNSFTHSMGFGSTESSVITNGTLSLSAVLEKPNVTALASPYSTSTTVTVHALDGLVTSNDKATITNNQAAYSGTYSLTVPAGTRINPNVTILSDPPAMGAVRTLSAGSVTNGALVSVSITLRNTAISGTVENIGVNDSWWRAYPSVFALSAGNTSFTLPSLGAGQNTTRVYVLKVITSAANDIVIPATAVTYSYVYSSTANSTVNVSTLTNQNELRTNDPGPAIQVQTQADTRTGTALGTTQHYLVTVTNLGDGAALNVQSGGQSNPTLTQGGGVWNFNTTIPFTSIVQRNFSQTFTASYTAPDGSQHSVVSNPMTLIDTHTGVLIPMLQFNLVSSFTPAILKSGVANATYTLTNAGTHPATSINVTQTFASGMACKSVVNGTAKCTSTGLSISASNLATGADLRGVVTFTFSNDNYLALPASIAVADGSLMLHNAGTSYVVPAGVAVTKTFAANPVFEGQNDTITVGVTNTGTAPVYNMSVSTTSDAFDTAFTGTLHQSYASLPPGSQQSFNYTVRVTGSGNHTGAATSVSFTLGGTTETFSYAANSVYVYKAIAATTTTSPVNPVEGNSFALAVRVTNPSTVGVTNVTLSFKLPEGVSVVGTPQGLEVSGRTITLDLPSLAAGASATQSVNLKASSDGNVVLSGAVLKFQYIGQTIPGVVSSPAITVGVDLSVRYELPIALAVILTLALALYMHRKLPASQK